MRRRKPVTELDIDAVNVLPPARASLFRIKILKNAVRSEQDTSDSMYDSAKPISAKRSSRTQKVSLLTVSRAYGDAELRGPQLYVDPSTSMISRQPTSTLERSDRQVLRAACRRGCHASELVYERSALNCEMTGLSTLIVSLESSSEATTVRKAYVKATGTGRAGVQAEVDKGQATMSRILIKKIYSTTEQLSNRNHGARI